MKLFNVLLAVSVSSVSGCMPIVEGVGTSSSTGPFGPGAGPEPPTTGGTPTTTGVLATTTTTTDDTTDTGDTDDTTGAADPPVCGNGVIEGDEACDDDIMGNGPGKLCSDNCVAATCGDGDVQASNDEACDDGPLNNALPGYGECSTMCQRGGFCGDGVVQPEGGEECEPSGGLENNCVAMCRLSPRVIFLTSKSFTGDLAGVAGADKTCNELAAASPELTGTYRAWLLVDGQALTDRFPEFNEPVAWNFTNLGADLLAKSFQDLVALGPESPVAYTELGLPRSDVEVWTNITAAGAAAGGDCAQWTSTAGPPALVGHSGFIPDQGPLALQWHDERWWTDWAGLKRACSKTRHLYCIQVGD